MHIDTEDLILQRRAKLIESLAALHGEAQFKLAREYLEDGKLLLVDLELMKLGFLH